MELLTKNPVEINVGKFGKESGIVSGKIAKIDISGDYNKINVHYVYTLKRESEKDVHIEANIHPLRNEEIDLMVDTMKDLLPNNFDEMTEREQGRYKYYIGFQIVMAETFDIKFEDIELVQDTQPIEDVQSNEEEG